MKQPPDAVKNEVRKEALTPIVLFEVYITDTDIRRFAAFNENVTFAGNTYYGYPITFSSIRSEIGTVDKINVLISNVTREMTILVARYDGLRGKLVKIFIVFYDLLGDPKNRLGLFEGYIDSVSVNQETASFEITSKLDVLGITLPRRIILRDRCQWQYKGLGCWLGDPDQPNFTGFVKPDGFIEPPDYKDFCTKTLFGKGGCEAHGNKIRFGGFPAIATGRVRIV